MEVNVALSGVDQTIKLLRGIPGGARLALQWSILYALRKGRRSAALAAQTRYVIPYGWLLRAIGRPRISGLTGYLHVSGTRARLSAFPHRDIYPEGVAIQELKEGPPIHLRHAFARNAAKEVYERETPQTKKYSIRTMVGLSAPAMIAQKSQVFPLLQQSLKQDVDKELHRLISALLAGQIVPKI